MYLYRITHAYSDEKTGLQVEQSGSPVVIIDNKGAFHKV